MQDEDFLPELRQNNELLIKYLTQDRLLELVDLISIEPPFDANACRCFKLPFVAQQALCIESEFIMSQVIEDPEFKILNRLMQFISVPEEVQLNSTLCGYFNKIISYWLIKKPAPMVKFFDLNQHYLNDIVEHVYLNSSIIDIIIRIFCVQDLSEEEVLTLNSIRCEIIHNTINKLEHYQDDYFMTEQLFCIWTGLLKKCYVMLNPKSLFDEILSPFTLKPILDYTFQPQFGKHTCMGAEFLSLLIFNLFISEPHDAIQDVLEVNFGFQVTSVAGMQVEQSQNEKEKEEENKKEGEETKEENNQKPGGESSALQQAERAKAELIKDKTRIYQKDQIDQIVVFLFANEIENFESVLCQPIIPTMVKVKLYELLSALIQMDDSAILTNIYKSKILNFIIIDYDKFENNSNLLILLNSTVKSILTSRSESHLADKLLFDLNMIQVFSGKLDH